MKILLDEMWSPKVAQQLRQRGYDVVAIAEQSELRGQPDSVVFAAAQEARRTIVTENVVDYRPLAVEHSQRGFVHAGFIFTSNRRFPRHDDRTVGSLIIALVELIETGPDLTNQEHWL